MFRRLVVLLLVQDLAFAALHHTTLVKVLADYTSVVAGVSHRADKLENTQQRSLGRELRAVNAETGSLVASANVNPVRIFAPDYRIVSGVSQLDPTRCSFYSGGASTASVCGGSDVRALFRDETTREDWAIETGDFQFAYKLSDIPAHTQVPFACGHKGHVPAHRMTRFDKVIQPRLPESGPAFVRVLLVAGYELYDVHRANTSRVLADAFNAAALLYSDSPFSPAVRLLLAAQIVVTAPGVFGEPLTGLLNSDALLDVFGSWVAARALTDGIDYDVAAFMNKRTFADGILGSAYVDTSCAEARDVAVAVVSVNTGSSRQDAATLAHEIGHSLGMCHDPPATRPGACPALPSGLSCGGAVMAASASSTVPTEFSDCSASDFVLSNDDDARPDVPCFAEPDEGFIDWFNTSVCGDGWLQVGEECDPGANGSACCDNVTCLLVPGALCDPSADACCESTCEASVAGTVCRVTDPARGSCDTPEACDGTNFACPADTVATTCKDDEKIDLIGVYLGLLAAVLGAALVAYIVA